MNMTLHKSVREYLGCELHKADPALYLDKSTGVLSVESRLSPHDGQIEIASGTDMDQWADVHDLSDNEIIRLSQEAYHNASR